MFNAEHKVENIHLPLERHDYAYSKRAAAYNFFRHHLKLPFDTPYVDGYKEDFVTILSPDELKVFNKEHHWPKNALQEEKAIIEYLKIGI